MLNEMCQEWDTALKNAVSVEDRMNEDGRTFEYRKSVVRFRGTEIEVIAKRRPGSGLAKDADVDPSKGPSYLVTLFVPSTGKIIEAVPSSSLCPKTAKVIMILEALDVLDRSAIVADRVKQFNENLIGANADRWNKELADTCYTDEEKQIFLDYTKTLAIHPRSRPRADKFIRVVVKFHQLLAGKDLDFINPRLPYTFTDVVYNLVCQLLADKRENQYKEDFIPVACIKNRFWNQDNPEWELKMPIYVQKSRSLFRQIYTEIDERPVNLAVIAKGLAKYYEHLTGESVALRTAREQERRKAKNAMHSSGKDGKGNFRPRRIETKALGSMEEIMKGIKL